MNPNKFSQYRMTNFKRKRKSNDDKINNDNYKRLIMEDDYQSLTDSLSSSSTTPLFTSNFQNETNLEEFSLEGLSSDDCQSTLSKTTTSSVKVEAKAYNKPIKYDQNIEYNDQDTFCVDMGRYRNFTTSKSISTYSNTNYLNFESSPKKITSSATPARAQRNRKSRISQVYKPHKHNKNINVTLIPCKGPACQSQICCAQYCSVRCYTNQMRPIGTGHVTNSIKDYDAAVQQEIDITDYGLPYPDHTYCRDHKNIYFTSDPNIDVPPYCTLVEEIFYSEKEIRIKNPRPEPNINGDPISTNGYVSQVVKRGRPKRSTVVGLLDPYIFHPSTDVVYTPFVFKENILRADRLSNQLCSDKPLKQAIRQSSSLYKDVRSDVPHEIIYPSNSCTEIFENSSHDVIKREAIVGTNCDTVIYDLYDNKFSIQ